MTFDWHTPPPPPPADMKPRYCQRCGTKLLPNPERYGYNTTTGEPKILDFGRCPNRRWWNYAIGDHS